MPGRFREVLQLSEVEREAVAVTIVVGHSGRHAMVAFMLLVKHHSRVPSLSP
jgi:hypothetical protein